MAAEAALARPAVVRPSALDRREHRSFLADVVIDHGPRDVLGRLFLAADTALREKGMLVSFVDFDELLAVNRANPDSWPPIVPIFDPTVSDINRRNAFALVGRDMSGRPVWAHASRHYSLGGVSLKEKIESLDLFYRDPKASAWPGEAAVCSAPIANEARGEVSCIGAAWLHPEWRGRGIQELTRPIQRAITFTRWHPDLIFSFMSHQLIKAGYGASSRLHIDSDVQLINSPVKRAGTYHGAIVWIRREEQVAQFPQYLAEISAGANAQVDGSVLERPGDKKLAV